MKKRHSDIAGVILSGGKNSRFDGKQKALLKIKGKTIIENTVSVLENIFEEVFVITNNPDDYNSIVSAPMYSDIIKNIGPIGGIHSALTHTTCKAIFVIASDMPFANEQLIRELTDNYLKHDFEIFVSQTETGIEPLHSLYNKSIHKKLEDFIINTGDFSVRNFLKHVKTGFYNFSDSAKDCFVNINCPDDYKNIKY